LVVGGGGIPSERKWIWAGEYVKFEPLNGVASTVESGTLKSLTVKVPGALLHPLDPEVESIDVLSFSDREIMQAKQIGHTWGVSDSDLRAVVSAMYERLDVSALLQLIPKHGKSTAFPYSTSNGTQVSSGNILY
jgi:hypothetical protein